jgi:uridine phosphorylase
LSLAKAIINPIDQLRYDEKQGLPSVPYPRNVIACFSGEVIQEIKKRFKVRLVDRNWWGWIYEVRNGSSKVGLTKFGIGDSNAGISLELLIAKGVRNIIAVGTAGALQKGTKIGEVVLVSKAIRDEGVSNHYEPRRKFSYPSPTLTDVLERELKKAGTTYRKGTAWTIDAPFRETVNKAKRLQHEGVLAVEMEAAALFSIAKFRGADVASLIWISDNISRFKWDPQFYTKDYLKGRSAVVNAAIEAFSH